MSKAIFLNLIMIFIFITLSSVTGQVNDPVTVWTNKYASGMLRGELQLSDMITDDKGNICVTGYVNNFESSNDYITIKYNSSGVEQWRATYNGPANSFDAAQAIAVDAAGNVYVTGGSQDNDSERDFATIKYDANGNEQWVARYDGPGNGGYDKAHDIKIDEAGNVYICGDSDSPTDGDFATIKYNSNGEEQWVARYDGPDSEGADMANKMALDAAGNVYVTGRSDGNGTKDDYATIKYNNNGVQQWLARYDGPDNQTDQPADIAVDDSGNVFVTGSSTNAQYRWNYATVKYDSSGVEQWSARHTGTSSSNDNALALVVNDSGQVYVTGNSYAAESAEDFTTIKYSPSGAELWQARYNGAANGNDKAMVIQLDADGNIFVAGQSGGCAAVKYTPGGAEIWSENYPDITSIVALRIVSGGDVVLTGYTYRFSATVKFSGSGSLLWDVQEDGPGLSYEDPQALALDADGNLYVAGITRRPDSETDFSLIKYDSTGNELWTATYDGTGSSSDYTSDMVTDESGNVYIAGSSNGDNQYYDWAVVKFSSTGEEQWAARLDGAGQYRDEARAVTVDQMGNVYVAGLVSPTASNLDQDMAVAKYNSTGAEEWIIYYDGTDHGIDFAEDVAVDDSGNVFITGISASTSGLYDIATIKYDSNGTQKWIARYDGPDNSYDMAVGLVLDGLGNIIVTGGSKGSDTNYDFVTVKYNASGIEQWSDRIDGPGSGWDEPAGLGVDNDGNVYVTGYGLGLYDNDDFITAKYDAAGNQIWMSTYNGPGYQDDRAVSLAVGPQGTLYVTGTSEGWYGTRDIATIKYDTSGIRKWEKRFDLRTEQAADIVSDGRGNIYVTGQSMFDYDTEALCVIIRYTEEIIADLNIGELQAPQLFHLSQNYPNPFNPTTMISYQLPVNSIVDLSVYNIIGQKLVTLVSDNQPTGNYKILWDASAFSAGIYFYQLKTNTGFSQSRKLILLK